MVDWMIGIESKPQITDCHSRQSDRVVCNLTALDGCKAAFGASSLRSKRVFIFRADGKVQQASLEPDGEEWAGYWSGLEAEMAWAAGQPCRGTGEGRYRSQPKGGRLDSDQAVQGVWGEPEVRRRPQRWQRPEASPPRRAGTIRGYGTHADQGSRRHGQTCLRKRVTRWSWLRLRASPSRAAPQPSSRT